MLVCAAAGSCCGVGTQEKNLPGTRPSAPSDSSARLLRPACGLFMLDRRRWKQIYFFFLRHVRFFCSDTTAPACSGLLLGHGYFTTLDKTCGPNKRHLDTRTKKTLPGGGRSLHLLQKQDWVMSRTSEEERGSSKEFAGLRRRLRSKRLRQSNNVSRL